jgi:hypothetical protein
MPLDHSLQTTSIVVGQNWFVFFSRSLPPSCLHIHLPLLFAFLLFLEKRFTVLMNEVGQMRSQANSMTLYEQFQKAQQETDNFVNAADGFASMKKR